MYELIGKFKGKFNNRSGESITYYKFYAQRLEPPEGDLEGLMVEELRVPAHLFDSLLLGYRFVPYYNKYGKIDFLHVLDSDE